MTDLNRHLLALSAQIVAAHTAHNEVGIDHTSGGYSKCFQYVS